MSYAHISSNPSTPTSPYNTNAPSLHAAPNPDIPNTPTLHTSSSANLAITAIAPQTFLSQVSSSQDPRTSLFACASDPRSLPVLSSQRQIEEMEQEERGQDTGHSSPSVSSSQGDMADNEMEAGPSQPQPPASSGPPPKKKRTRTLTTPHQAAVLHALLAQSRFPTTAMREEVGRAIGLSARKVQIWFQNQRQKARRPRGQNVPPLTRPPQFGPFYNAPQPSSFGEPSTDAGPSTYRGDHPESQYLSSAPYEPSSSVLPPAVLESLAFRDFRRAEDYPRGLGASTQLSGPGIPVTTGNMYHPYRDMPTRPMSMQSDPRASAAPHGSIPPSRQHDVRPTTAVDPMESGHLTSRQPRLYPMSEHEPSARDFPILLPPLSLEPHSAHMPLSNRTSLAPIRTLGLPPSPVDHRHSAPLSRRPDSPFTLQTPVYIPPPFTLQPQPQWDDPSFSPFSRAGSSYTHPPSSGYNALASLPPLLSSEHVADRRSSLPALRTTQPPSTAASAPLSWSPTRPRFDPIRSTSSFRAPSSSSRHTYQPPSNNDKPYEPDVPR